MACSALALAFVVSPVPSSGWGHERLADPRLAYVWLRLKRLKELGVIVPKVMKEFL